MNGKRSKKIFTFYIKNIKLWCCPAADPSASQI